MKEAEDDFARSREAVKKKGGFKEIPNPYNPFDFKAGRTYYNKRVVEKLKKLFEADPPQKIVFIQGKEGSGKSSTLNRVKRDPEILGEGYIPIYIDLNKVFTEDRYGFLFKFYDRLKKSIDRISFPYLIDELDTIKENITIDDIRDFFKSLVRQKDSQSVILLIFDDFDKLFQLEEWTIALPIIDFFKKLLAANDQFRILLSRSGEIPERIKHNRISQCLKDILGVRMGISDPQEFYQLIEDPVKERVTYLTSALKEIRRITGGNLYCQQLICHYIILHLNAGEKDTCDREDVAAAVELTIRDEREDFEYFWKRLPYEEKMVCAAMVDGSIVSIKGRFYYIEPGSILEEIFEPRVLNEILNRLYNNDFIYRTLGGRRFEAFPFKIPLFGLWIREKYPFDRVVVENIETIANQKDFTSLEKIFDRIPKELFPADRLNAIECVQKWFELKNLLEEEKEKRKRVGREKTQGLVKAICKTLGFSIKKDPRETVDYFTINFKELGIGSIKEAVFIIQDRLTPSQTDTFNFAGIIDDDVKSFRPNIFFCFKINEKIKELDEKKFLNIIRVEGKDLKKILFSPERPRAVFKEFLLQRLAINQISPYQTEGPTILTFFGRHRELQRIMASSHNSFVIVGARRIGKSSLIMRVKNELDELGVGSLYLDLESPPIKDYKTFLYILEFEFSRSFKRKFHFGASLNQFILAIKNLNRENRRFVIILDEIDELLKFDEGNGYELIRTFRRLSHERVCQFILSGFEVLYNSKRDNLSPLFNFGEEKQLGPLDIKDALALITDPMANMGVKYREPSDRKLILDYTSRHPNLLQFFCKQLIEKIADRDANKRTIFKNDIQDLYDSEYEKYIINDFYIFYKDLSNLEKLFVLTFSTFRPEEREFSIASVNGILEARGISLMEDQIHKTLQKLKLRFILIEKGQGKYSFALPHFPEILNKRKDVALLESLIKRVKEGNYGKPSQPLHL